MRTYSSSGIVPITGGIVTALAGLTAAVVCGFVYGNAFHWIPIGFLRIFLCIGYCFAIGIAIAATGKRMKIRSPTFITVLAILCTLLGLWIYWGAYRTAKEGAAAGLAAWSPQELIAFGQRLFENGSFKIRRSTIDGWLLVGFWITEVVAMFMLIVGSAQAHVWQPFCEACEEWTTTRPGMIRLAADGKEPAWEQIFAGDFALLATFPLANAEVSPHVRLDLATCPKCTHSNYLSLAACTIKYDKKGKPTTKEESLLSHGVLNDIQAEMIRRLADMLAKEPGQDYARKEDEIEDGSEADQDSTS